MRNVMQGELGVVVVKLLQILLSQLLRGHILKVVVFGRPHEGTLVSLTGHCALLSFTSKSVSLPIVSPGDSLAIGTSDKASIFSERVHVAPHGS